MKRAKAHIPQLAANAIPEDSALGIAGTDLQVRASSFGHVEIAGSEASEGFSLHRRKSNRRLLACP
jgi:hypothetical protein